MNATRIVIIAKAPIPGFAKTRLIPALGAEGAAALASRMLEHAVQAAVAAGVGTVELCVTPSPRLSVWQQLSLPAGIVWSEQGGGGLGARMARAARRTIEHGECVLLTGTDCPALGTTELRAAACALQSHDAALVPASDGGYALLGLAQFHPALFAAMPWSTADVARETLDRLARLEWKATCLAPLHDIDTPADLQHVPAGWLHTSRTAGPHAAVRARSAPQPGSSAG